MDNYLDNYIELRAKSKLRAISEVSKEGHFRLERVNTDLSQTSEDQKDIEH